MIEQPGREIRRRLSRSKPQRSQKWLAEQLGVSEGYVSKIINAEVGISPPIALKLADALGDDGEYWICLQGRFDVARERLFVAERAVATSSQGTETRTGSSGEPSKRQNPRSRRSLRFRQDDDCGRRRIG